MRGGFARPAVSLTFELLAHATYDGEGQFPALPDLAANLKHGNAVLASFADETR
ncbi:hypothetical protein G3N59_29745, partial [Paraburkholderia sp. Ac-20340]|nr:hypothetical protein [Paraburkholderia sp. Ac-20340]